MKRSARKLVFEEGPGVFEDAEAFVMEDAPFSRTPERWPVTSRYEVRHVIGEGSYGQAYTAILKSTGQMVVIKKLILYNAANGIPATSLREIALLRELDHPHVVRLIDAEQTVEGYWLLVFELLACDLHAFVRGREHRFRRRITYGSSRLSLPLIKLYMHQMLQAVDHLHSRGVIHRDLKPQNILVDDTGTIVKLADFGLARTAYPPTSEMQSEVVTVCYRAPELLLGDTKYSSAIDIWSLGCIMAELFNQVMLWPYKREIILMLRMFRDFGTPNEESWPGVTSLPYYSAEFPKWRQTPGIWDAMVPGLDAQGLELLQSMLVMNPAGRVSAKQALLHPWFNDLGNEVKSLLAHPAAELAEQSGSGSGEGVAPSCAPAS